MVSAILSFEGLDPEPIGSIIIGCNDCNGEYQPTVSMKIIRKATEQEYIEFCKKNSALYPYTRNCVFYEVEFLD